MAPRTVSYPYREIGHRISDLRREAGRVRGKRFTQREVAEAVGVAEGTVTAWETGKQRPEGENLFALATLFGASPEFILTGQESAETAASGSSLQATRDGDGDSDLLSEERAIRLLGDIAPPGEAADLKADQLQLIRRVALRKGIEPQPWWYDLLRRVDAGQL